MNATTIHPGHHFEALPKRAATRRFMDAVDSEAGAARKERVESRPGRALPRILHFLLSTALPSIAATPQWARQDSNL
jgi:hypothetical protein